MFSVGVYRVYFLCSEGEDFDFIIRQTRAPVHGDSADEVWS